MKEQTCFFTGHREVPPAEEARIYENICLLCESLVEKMNIRTFICGGARGFDTLAARAVLALQKKNEHIRLQLILPCKDQAARWNRSDQKIYREILAAADLVEYVSEHYTSYCMHARNRRMVDESCCGIIFMRQMTGGTAYTVKYAIAQDVELFSVDRVPPREEK